MQQEGHVSSEKAGRPGGARALRRALFAAVAALALVPARAESPDFRHRPLLAGKASLTEPGFVVRRELGVANFSPELRLPVELVYESSSERTGLFGFAWRCPQLESSVRWERDGLLWTTPWGERVKFFPKREKTPKDAVKLAPVEAAKRGRGLFAPWTDWESDTESPDWTRCRRFSIAGKNGLRGWRFEYADGRLASASTPHGTSVLFERGPSGELLAVSSRGVRFVELAYADGLVASLRLNGVAVALAYGASGFLSLPKTADGLASRKSVRVLASVRVAALDPEAFAYVDGYLASASRGGHAERFAVQTETPADRKRNILSKDKKNNVAHTGKVAGRLLSDGDYRYGYPGETEVRLTDALGGTALHAYDARVGTHRVTDFSGRTTTAHYFMRHDVAYLGKVRKVVDGRDRDLVSFRYDRAGGKPVRVTDRLGNSRLLDYDGRGNCVKLSRRADGAFASEPVRAFSYDRQDRLAAVSELDGDGKAVRTTAFAYDGAGRPVRISDGCRTLAVAYGPSGFPSELKGDFGGLSLAYDRYNRLVSATGPDGLATRRTYAGHGALAKVERLCGQDVLASVSVAYDGCGRPVSATDRDGRTTACDRDALGRIVRETCADGAEVAYGYDGLGRLAKVVDENGHEIAFGWDRFGLASRLTAADQLTSAKRGADGLVAEIASSVTGRVDRAVRVRRDGFDRVVEADYGNGEVETFAYDAWGRLAEHARGSRTETYRYDHFGRLARKTGGGAVVSFSYDAWGRRTRRTVRLLDGGGETVDERRAYDRYGRLVEIAASGTTVRYAYDGRGRVARQTVDGTPIDFAYTRDGRLAGKYLGGRLAPEASVEYEYTRDGRIAARTANGVRQAYEYDARGRLLAVKEDGSDVERYAYDRAGNMVRKTVRGKTTAFTFDGANQLVSSTTGGVTTRYAYDAAGRLVREGAKTYRYGWLDKVLSVTDGARTYRYDWHADGQLARADYGDGTSESFLWDGLALVRRGGEDFVNEPHAGGGSPVASSKGAVYFNDLLGTTVGVREGRGPLRAKQGAKAPRYTAAALTAFGEPLPGQGAGVPASGAFFTGKPSVPGLGYAFLLRSYRSDLAKWQTADPFGYPDGWNRLVYCGNDCVQYLDFLGSVRVICYDLNDYGRIKGSDVFLRMVEGRSSAFTFFYSEFIDSGNEITVNLNVSLQIAAGLSRSFEFDYGEITEYKKHTGSNNDSVFNYPVYEAVCAHERGHASSFFSEFVPYFTQLLQNQNLDSYSGSSGEQILSVITACFQEALRDFLPKSNEMANSMTHLWFAGHSEWKYKGLHNGFDRWIKE